jgi:hypothetical protein
MEYFTRLLGFLALSVSAFAGAYDITVHNNTAISGQLTLSRYQVGCSGTATTIASSPGAVAPGASWTYTGITQSYYSNYLSSGQCMYAYRAGSPNVFSTPAPFQANIYIGGAPPAQTNCFYQFPINNNNASIQTFYAAKNLAIDMTKTLVLGPGLSGILEFEAPCSESNQWQVLWAPYGEPDYVNVTPQITNLDDTPGTNLLPVVVEKPAPTSYNPDQAWGTGGTNPPIQFTGTNDQQVGFSALYDAITKHAAQTDANLKALQGQQVTNSTGWPSDFPDQGTHERLDMLINLQTNGSILEATNAWGSTATEQGGFDEAMTIEPSGSFEVPGYSDGFWKVDLGSGVPNVSVPLFDLSFTQQGLSEVWTTGKALILWGLVIAYAIKVMKDIFDICFLVGAGSQLKKPNVDIKFLGTGGDWGIALTPVIVGVFLAIWGAALLWMTGATASAFTGVSWTSIMWGGPFGTVGSSIVNGIAASALLVPWEQVFAVSTAYIIFLGSKNICAGSVVTGIKLLVS